MMSCSSSAIWVILVLLKGSSLIDAQTATHATETTLRANLQTGYDQSTRPSTPTYIDIRYFLRSVQSLDISAQQFSHTAMLIIAWEDPRLVWDPSTYSNITELDINWTWRPAFTIGNSAYSYDTIGGDDSVDKATVYSNGTVLWLFMLLPTTSCDVDILHFPYDSQECSVYLAFMGHTYDYNLVFNLSSTMVMTGIYLENAEWTLVSSSMQPAVIVTCCPEVHMGYLNVAMKFDRLHAFYTNTFLLPNILLSICLVWPFYLPTDSGERLSFALTILLSYMFVLSLTSEYLPTTSKQVPYIATYLLGVLFMCTIATCNVAIHVKLYYKETTPPGYMKTFHRKMRPVVFMECKGGKSAKVHDNVVVVRPAEKSQGFTETDRDDEDSTSGETEEVTWQDISIVMDRTCFIVYSLVVALMNTMLMVFLLNG